MNRRRPLPAGKGRLCSISKKPAKLKDPQITQITQISFEDHSGLTSYGPKEPLVLKAFFPDVLQGPQRFYSPEKNLCNPRNLRI